MSPRSSGSLYGGHTSRVVNDDLKDAASLLAALPDTVAEWDDTLVFMMTNFMTRPYFFCPRLVPLKGRAASVARVARKLGLPCP